MAAPFDAMRAYGGRHAVALSKTGRLKLAAQALGLALLSAAALAAFSCFAGTAGGNLAFADDAQIDVTVPLAMQAQVNPETGVLEIDNSGNVISNNGPSGVMLISVGFYSDVEAVDGTWTCADGQGNPLFRGAKNGSENPEAAIGPGEALKVEWSTDFSGDAAKALAGTVIGSAVYTFEAIDTAPYGLLYEDGTLVLQRTDHAFEADAGHGTVTARFPIDEAYDGSGPAWANSSTVTSAVVSESFRDVRLPTCKKLFYGMAGMESITGLENLNLADVKSLWCMFWGCESLRELDLTSWDTSKIEDTYGAFERCFALERIYVSEAWSMESVTNSSYMMGQDTSLVGGDGTPFNLLYRDASWANPDSPDSPGYLSYAGEDSYRVDYDLNFEGAPDAAFSNRVQLGKRFTVGGVGRQADYHRYGFKLKGWTLDAEGQMPLLATGDTYIATTDTVLYAQWEAFPVALIYDNKEMVLSYGIGDDCAKNPDHTGVLYELAVPEYSASVSDVPWVQRYSSFTKVTFDASFKEACPASAAFWFYNHNRLTEVRGFENLANVTEAKQMFYMCSGLTTIYATADWDNSNITSSSSMFSSCRSLTGGNGTHLTSGHYTADYARIDTEDAPGYFTLYEP